MAFFRESGKLSKCFFATARPPVQTLTTITIECSTQFVQPRSVLGTGGLGSRNCAERGPIRSIQTMWRSRLKTGWERTSAGHCPPDEFGGRGRCRLKSGRNKPDGSRADVTCLWFSLTPNPNSIFTSMINPPRIAGYAVKHVAKDDQNSSREDRYFPIGSCRIRIGR